MYNTILLLHGIGEIEAKGDAIFGVDSCAREIRRWPIGQKAEALAELAKYRCAYRSSSTFTGSAVTQADEWALEFCECGDGGEYITGADYELAAEQEV